MNTVIRNILILALAVALISILLSYVTSYEVRPTVFSANGWAKKLEVNIPVAGLVEFNVPVQEGMSAHGQDVVLVDKNGNVLKYVVWSGYQIPYTEVYKMDLSFSSDILTFLSVPVFTGEGVGIFDQNYRPVVGFKYSSGYSVSVPYDTNFYYVGKGGVESSYILDAGSGMSVESFNSKFKVLDLSKVKIHRVSFPYMREYGGRVAFNDDLSEALFSIIYGSMADHNIYYYKCTGSPVHGYTCQQINYGVCGDGYDYFYMDGNWYAFNIYSPKEYRFCYDHSRLDDPMYIGYNGVAFYEINEDNGLPKRVVWHDRPYPDEYAAWCHARTMYGDYVYFTFYECDRLHNSYDENWTLNPFIVVVGYNFKTGERLGVYNIYLKDYEPIPTPYKEYILVEPVVLGDNLYVFARFDTSYGRTSYVFVFDSSTIRLKYYARFPFAVQKRADVYDIRSGGMNEVQSSYILFDNVEFPGLTLNVYGDHMFVVGIDKDQTGASNPALTLVDFDGNFIPFVIGGPGVLLDWVGYDNEVGLLVNSDGRIAYYQVPESHHSGCCTNQYSRVFVTDDGVLLFVFEPNHPNRNSYVHFIWIPRDALVDPVSDPINVSVSMSLVPPSDEDVVHVRAYVPESGTYYLYYDSERTWYHLDPPDGVYIYTDVTVRGPFDVHISPYVYELNIFGDGTHYTVEVNYGTEDGLVYSQCFWNGAQMDQLFPGHHVVTLSGSSPVEYNLDCYALEVAELHESGVLAFREANDLPAELTVSPNPVDVNGLVTLSYTGDNPTCYLIWNGGHARVDYPRFAADFPEGEYTVLCDGPGYEPAEATLRIQQPSLGGGGGFAPLESEEVPTQPTAVQPFQPASPLPLSGSIIALIVVLALLYYMSRRRR